MIQAKLGNTLWETYDYATSGTPTVYRLGTAAGTENRMRLEYNFSGTANNGNIMSQKISVSGGANLTQTFYYDGVNRLSRAIESGGYDRTYGYDRWSNRWVSSSSGLSYVDNKEPTSSSQFDTATNRLTNATYDAAGNQLSYNGYTFEYNAAGQNTVVKTNAGAVYTTNTYDGNGNRVKKVEGSVTTYYIYDALGRLAAEYTSAAPEVGTSYVFTDMLGSVRAITSNAGALQECYDYLPFGRMLSSSDNGRPGCHPVSPDISAGSNSRASQKFTGQPRDNGPKLDYFGARFYSASLGRFTSPDPITLTKDRMAQPHRLNLYAYVSNNPILYIDPSGLTTVKSDQPFPGAMFNNEFGDYRINVKDGFNREEDLKRITWDDIYEQERIAYERLQDIESIYGGKTRWEEARFDTEYWKGYKKRKYYHVEGQDRIYADNEINYIGIGMYEAWLGSSKTIAHTMTRLWKLRYIELDVSPGTFYWLEQGFDAYSKMSTGGRLDAFPKVKVKRR